MDMIITEKEIQARYSPENHQSRLTAFLQLLDKFTTSLSRNWTILEEAIYEMLWQGLKNSWQEQFLN